LSYLANRQTNKQTKSGKKHYLLGGGNDCLILQFVDHCYALCIVCQASGSMPAQLVTQSGENYVVHGTVDGSSQIAHTIRASPATVSESWLL